MASLDSLPPDQRAVLQLVLQRGRSYDDIAKLLSIDRAGVRDRALQAFDALGPQTRVAADRRALITDYLLGQLPSRVADDVRARLGESASERAWARVLASELAPLATAGGLPEIPSDASAGPARTEAPDEAARGTEPPVAEPIAAAGAAEAEQRSARARERQPAARERQPAARERPAPQRERDTIPPDYGLGGPGETGPRSRTGGAVLLGLGAAIVVAVIVILIATSGSDKPKHTSTAASTPTTTPTGTTGTGTTTTTNGAKVIAQVNLRPPSGAKSPAGVAEVLQSGTSSGVAILAQGMAANTKHNAYAVWLYNSGSDARLLGFVSPGVGSNGKMSTEGALPSDASHFKQLVVTLESQAKPKTPGTIVLVGAPQAGQSL